MNKNDILNSKISFANLVKEMKSFNRDEHAYDKRIKLAVVGSSSIQYLTSILKFTLNLRNIDVEVYEGPYDGVNSCLF